MTKPIFIVKGFNYSERSAGPYVLHKLAELLADAGADAYIAPCQIRDGSRVRIFTKDLAKEGQKFITILPEVSGNETPWADLTVHWLLNTPGKSSPDVSWTWDKKDLLCHWDPFYAMKDSMPLSVPHVDRSIFNNDNNPDDQNRELDCYYGRKTKMFGKIDNLCPSGAKDISEASLSLTQLASFFRKVRTFYTSEMTACTIEAVLCGAKAVFIPSGYLPVSPRMDTEEWYSEIEKRSDNEIKNFIDVCYERVGFKELAYA